MQLDPRGTTLKPDFLCSDSITTHGVSNNGLEQLPILELVAAFLAYFKHTLHLLLPLHTRRSHPLALRFVHEPAGHRPRASDHSVTVTHARCCRGSATVTARDTEGSNQNIKLEMAFERPISSRSWPSQRPCATGWRRLTSRRLALASRRSCTSAAWELFSEARS